MKRTFRRPDGTEETLEGTAEELAEYERKLKREQADPPRPPVLKGAELDGEPVTDQEVEYLRSFRKLLRDPNTFRVPDPAPIPWQPLAPWPPYRVITVPHTSDQIRLNPTVVVQQPCRYCGEWNCQQTHIICESVTLTGDSTAQLMQDHPEWDWSGMNVCGGNWHVQ